ncbi:hypothetical protein LCGC14_1385230 [marine sediment metagenome]|uniref:Uncharacterized protein n=1 Tax=marine sediment metagenome TaxID=412755 RepID=A0A0F9K1K1_9ZZZZ
MATKEFEQAGSTSGQRLASLKATHPPKSGADRFAENVLERSPEIAGLLAPPTAAPDGSRFNDLSRTELLEVLRAAKGRPHSMSPDQAAQVSDALREIDG